MKGVLKVDPMGLTTEEDLVPMMVELKANLMDCSTEVEKVLRSVEVMVSN